MSLKPETAPLTESERDELLSPLIVIVLPRATEAVALMAFLAEVEYSRCHAIALAESEADAAGFKSKWRIDQKAPLLIVRTKSGDGIQLVHEALLKVVAGHPGRPVGVLIGDGPECEGYRSRRRREWNERLAKLVGGSVRDSQTFEYARTWQKTPPRIR